MATVAQLDVKIGADLKAFNKGMGSLQAGLQQAGAQARRLGKTFSLSLTAPIVALGAKSIQAFNQQQQALAQVEAAVKSTAGAAGFAVRELEAQAASLQRNTIFGDEQILKEVTANLLTFTRITGDEFVKTQGLVLDLATRMGTDLTSATLQLGKALNDPVANLGALGRAGIQFTKEQKEVIKSLVEGGKQAEAQRIILDELETQFGGAAEAAAQAGLGGFKQFQNALGDLLEQVGELLIPYLNNAVRVLSGVVDRLQAMSPEAKKTALAVAGLAAAIGPALFILGGMASGLSSILRVMTMTAGLFNPYVLGFSAVAAIFVGLTRNADGLGAAFKNFQTLIVETFAPAWEGLKEVIGETYGVIVGWWSVNGEAVKTTLTDTFTALITNVGALLGTLADVFKLAWQATEDVTKLFIGDNGTLVTLFTSGAVNLVNSVGATIALLASTINTTIEQVAGALKATTLAAGGKFDQAFQALKDIPKSNIDAMLAFFESMKSDIDASIDTDIAKDAAEAVVGKEGDTFADKIKSVIDSAVSGFVSFKTDIADPLQNDADSVSDTVGDTAEDIDGLKNSVDGLFKIAVDPKTINEAVRAVAPSEDEVSRMDSFRHHFKRFTENLSGAKEDAFNVARYTRDIRDALDTLGIGADTPFGRFVSNTANLALDIATVVGGFESLINLFKLEIWGKTLDLFIKIGSAIWDIVSGLFAQQQIQNVGATIGGIGPGTMGPTVTGGPDLTTSGGGGLAGLLGGATVAGTLGIFGYGLQQMLTSTQQSLLEQGLSTAQVGTAVSLGGLLQGLGSMGSGGTPSWLSGLQGYMGSGGAANTSGFMSGMGGLFGSGSSGSMGQTINVNLDGQTIATATVPYMANELEVFGTNY